MYKGIRKRKRENLEDVKSITCNRLVVVMGGVS